MSRTGLSKAVSILVCALVCASVAPAQPGKGRGIPPSIRRHEVVPRPAKRPRDGRRLDVSFRALGRSFDLELEPNDLFAPGARDVWVGDTELRETAPRIMVYKGRVRGEPGSSVRLSLRGDGSIDGMIRAAEEVYFVEPRRRFFDDARTGEIIVYRLSDTEPEWRKMSCGLESVVRPRKRRPRPASTSDQTQFSSEVFAAVTTGTYKRVEMVIVADHEYYLRHGANAAANMQSIINQVDGVFRGEAGVTIQIAQTVVYSTPSDPFSSTTNPQTLLNEFSSYRNTWGSPAYGSDLAHLFTGRDLDSTVVGIAWLGSVCSSYYGAGLSQDLTTTDKSLVLLTAHEMGHNFSAPHDGQSGSACSSMPYGYIMWPSLSTSLNLLFSSCSKSHINNQVARSACLDTISSDMTPTPTGTPTATFTVTPTRTSTATHTATATRTATLTLTPTRTHTATHTRTATPTLTLTRTHTATHTRTATPTLTLTRTHTATHTRTATPTPTRTHTATHTRTATRTPTATWTRTPTRTATEASSPTPTFVTPTWTPTGVPTATRTWTATATATRTATQAPPPPTPASGDVPATIPDLVLWLDAGRIPGAMNLAPVCRWPDASGLGHDAVQSSSRRCPVYRTNTLNGQAVLRFDGSDDYLTNASMAVLSGATGATTFVVKKVDNTQSRVAFSVHSSNVIAQTLSSRFYTFATSASYGSVAAVSPLGWNIWTSVFDGSGVGNTDRLVLFVQGKQQTLSFAGTVPATLATGSGYTVGRSIATNTQYWDGDISEIIVYSRVLLDAERQAVIAYLAAKYGIVL